MLLGVDADGAELVEGARKVVGPVVRNGRRQGHWLVGVVVKAEDCVCVLEGSVDVLPRGGGSQAARARCWR